MPRIGTSYICLPPPQKQSNYHVVQEEFRKSVDVSKIRRWGTTKAGLTALYTDWYTFLRDNMQLSPRAATIPLAGILKSVGVAHDPALARSLRQTIFADTTTAVTTSARSEIDPLCHWIFQLFHPTARIKTTGTGRGRRMYGMLHRLLESIGVSDNQTFMACDQYSIDQALNQILATGDGPMTVLDVHCLRRVIGKAKRHKSMDPDLSFANHLQHAPRHTYDEFPCLWSYPGYLAKFITDLRDGDDREHVVAFLLRVTRAKTLQYARHREIQRIHRGVAEETVKVYRVVSLYAKTNKLSIDMVLFPDISEENLYRLVAQLIGRYYHTKEGAADRMVKTINGWIAHGLFPNARRHLARWALDQRLWDLEAMNPHEYQASRLRVSKIHERLRRHQVAITPLDVQRLQDACRSEQERLYLQLSMTTGLRTEALANLRVDDVWDAQRGCQRQRPMVTEKNSQVRTIMVTTKTADLLGRYLSTEHNKASAFLFPSRINPRLPYRTVARTILARICKRAGMPCLNHHKWRTYITDTAVGSGISVETVARFLGHRTPTTTYRYYLTNQQLDIESLTAHCRI